ncbi:MAG: lipid-A-disaccharide synthase [Bacteroidota bacterium]|nr:lipid-A-disaccharide synthase [Bacteroidota bacterium]
MRYYFIAGEASGDLHASNCIKEIIQLDSSATFAFTGGDLMQKITGVTPSIHIKQMAFMGFIDVLKNINTIKKNFKTVKQSILDFKPDALVLVDYPGFNLRMAKWAHEHTIKVYYYVSPTVWAWKEGRVETIRQFVKKLFVILPFEKAFYKKHNIEVDFVGHPLIDAIEQQKPSFRTKEKFIVDNNLTQQAIIAVLPGSRAQEINYMLTIMMGVMSNFNNYQFVVAGSTNLPQHIYEPLNQKGIKIVYNQTYELMSYAEAGIIKSGTSTLESALFKLPQVICYKAGGLSFKIGKMLVNKDIKHIGLPNIIMGKAIVKELVQNDLTTENICDELSKLLTDPDYKNQIIANYTEMEKSLGGIGASKRIAEGIVKDLKN